MNLEQVAHYIAHPHELGLAEAPALKSMSEKHPYAAVFSLLYLTALANGKSVDLDDALQQHAYKLSDRTKLYHLLHGGSDVVVSGPVAVVEEDTPPSLFEEGMREVINAPVETKSSSVTETTAPISQEMQEETQENPSPSLLEEGTREVINAPVETKSSSVTETTAPISQEMQEETQENPSPSLLEEGMTEVINAPVETKSASVTETTPSFSKEMQEETQENPSPSLLEEGMREVINAPVETKSASVTETTPSVSQEMQEETQENPSPSLLEEGMREVINAPVETKSASVTETTAPISQEMQEETPAEASPADLPLPEQADSGEETESSVRSEDFDRFTEAFTREQHFAVDLQQENPSPSLLEEGTREVIEVTEQENFTDSKRSFTSWLKSGDHAAESQAEENTPETGPAALVVPISTDAEPEPLKRSVDAIIENFIKEEPTITRGKTAFFSPSRKAKESLDEEALPVSETLAKIFAAQGNYPKAIHVYHQLMLSFPEKKSFFAVQIEALKKKITS